MLTEVSFAPQWANGQRGAAKYPRSTGRCRAEPLFRVLHGKSAPGVGIHSYWSTRASRPSYRRDASTTSRTLRVDPPVSPRGIASAVTTAALYRATARHVDRALQAADGVLRSIGDGTVESPNPLMPMRDIGWVEGRKLTLEW